MHKSNWFCDLFLESALNTSCNNTLQATHFQRITELITLLGWLKSVSQTNTFITLHIEGNIFMV